MRSQYKSRFIKIAMLVTGFSSLCLSALAETIPEEHETKVVSESATKTAQKLAGILAPKLKTEGSKVVFINLQACENPLSVSTWCQVFEANLTASLVKAGIRFLPEAQKDDIRKKIADEQLYQHDSMQVDSTKAVELGKQKAFQAFLSVAVASSGETTSIRASSTNIKEGLVTIAENMNVTFTTEMYTPITSKLKKWSFFTLGAGIAGYSVQGGMKEKDKSNEAFSKYKSATSSDEATKYRTQTEKHDRNKTIYDVGIWIGAGVIIYGFFVGNNSAISTDYEIETAAYQSKSLIRFDTVAFQSGVNPAISWQLEW